MTKTHRGPRVTRTCSDCGWTSSPCATPGIADAALARHSCQRHRDTEARRARGRDRRTRVEHTPKPCQHPRTKHQHGTCACYVRDQCRCRACSAANSAYEQARIRQHAYGRWNNLVDATEARHHIEALRAAGLGRRAIAQAAGVAHSTISALLYGKTSRREPTRRISRDTHTRILAVTTSALAPGAIVPTTGTTRRLQALIAAGWSGAHLAKHLAIHHDTLTRLIHGRRRALASTASAVSALYDLLWDEQPPSRTPAQRAAITRAKSLASAHRWAPPLAWDDDTIDDPAATPHGTDQERRVTKLEQILELIDLGCSLDAITARTNTSRTDIAITMRRGGHHAALERLQQRAGVRAS